MAQQWGWGFHTSWAVTVGSLLLLFLPVWDHKVKAELVMANGWYLVYVRQWGGSTEAEG